MTILQDKRESIKIALLPGDGQGFQLALYAKQVLEVIEQVRGNISLDVLEYEFDGFSLLPSTLQACRESDAVLLCGGGDATEELSALRKELGVDINVVPIRFPSSQAVHDSTRKDIIDALDLTLIYDVAGEESEAISEEAYGTTRCSRETIERLARWAGMYAMQSNPPKPVYSIHNNDAWTSTVTEIFTREFSGVPLDTAFTQVPSNPASLNCVILTESFFGDMWHPMAEIVSSQILASAAVSSCSGKDSPRKPGIFQPLDLKSPWNAANPLSIVQAVNLMLGISLGLSAEADALTKAIRRTLDPVELVGSNVRPHDMGGSATSDEFMEKLLENLDEYLEAANSADLAAAAAAAAASVKSQIVATKRRPMGVIEKIMTHAGVALKKAEVTPGEMICVKVDWTLTSEILWAGMEKTYDLMKRPRPYRNDRLWLAIDHTVDPRVNHRPRQRGLIEKAERFKREAKIIDFLPANTSILHTDFTRGRAQPGQIVIGCDSHTCSAGSMGSFAIGLGAADVVMPMVTGETWLRVPEVCRIDFVGELPFGVGGKDVILHILGIFKRNTIAFQRAVEYGGPGLANLSMDARFAIANMTTEFGGMGACFEADDNTAQWIAGRPHPQHREGGLYFRADPEAQYAERRTIDLSQVSLTIALYPNPDDVVPVTEKIGMRLDGCFIGACTTTEEDLILGALVLEAGLKAGQVPSPNGKRRVTPGSLTIIKNLERHGLLDVYKKAGFEVGAPGCSYCVGINDVDVAGEGEVWLSSQNRNFRHRMGKGSFGSITSAAVVAASSFDMTVTDPASLLHRLNKGKFENLVKSANPFTVTITPETQEPNPEISSTTLSTALQEIVNDSSDTPSEATSTASRILQSRIQRFTENVDTDAIIPAEFVPGVDNADLGSHCFQYYRPVFREKAQNGSRIIVADEGFGSGSSREDAVRALQGARIEAVIAKSFAFIYERNQLNMGLFNIVLTDEEFYANIREDSTMIIDKDNRTLQIDGVDKVFTYQQSEIEETLLEAGGILPLYSKFGRTVFRQITSATARNKKVTKSREGISGKGLDW